MKQQKNIQWVHYTKTCSDSAQGAYLSAETYKPIVSPLTWDMLESDCDCWAENVNRDHEVGHGGNCRFEVVEIPPTEWLYEEIKKYTKKVESDNKFLKLLESTNLSLL